MRLPPEVVEEAKEMVREVAGCYPGLEGDVGKALRSRYVGTVDLADVAWLLKYQNTLCSKCGECCRKVDTVRVTLRDLKRIAKYMNTSVEELLRSLRLKARGRAYVMEGPCPFHRGNICMIHPARPTVCREYPAGYILHQMVNSPDRKVIVSISCSIIRKMLASKLAAAILTTHLEKEHPDIAEQIEKLSTCPEDLAKQPLREQLKWIMEKIGEAQKHLKNLK
jgi:Fe-S-cluster containining protein